VKIKVRLGSQLEHYYILSRFLLSRMLTVITLPQHKVGAWLGGGCPQESRRHDALLLLHCCLRGGALAAPYPPDINPLRRRCVLPWM
jgi:hypothetical protein